MSRPDSFRDPTSPQGGTTQGTEQDASSDVPRFESRRLPISPLISRSCEAETKGLSIAHNPLVHHMAMHLPAAFFRSQDFPFLGAVYPQYCGVEQITDFADSRNNCDPFPPC